MSEETKAPEEGVVSEEDTKNIDNKIGDAPEKETHNVPLPELLKERKERQKWQKMYEDAQVKVQIADRLSKLSNGADTTTLQRQLDDLESKRAGTPTQPQYQQYTQPNTQPNTYDKEIREIKEQLADQKLETEFEKISNSGLLDVDNDIKEDVMTYAKEKGLSIKEAMFARYGETIINNRRKSETSKAKIEAAEKVLSTNSSSADIFSKMTERVELTAFELEAAKMMGQTPEEFALYASDDREAHAKYHKKK